MLGRIAHLVLQEQMHWRVQGQGHWENLGHLIAGERKAVLAHELVEVADIEQKPHDGMED